MSRPTYYGANVRIERRGLGLDGALVVQRANEVGGGWIDDATFWESASYCYSEAKTHAGNLAAQMWSSKTQG